MKWSSYLAEAKEAGLKIGGYWRFYPSVDRTVQMRAFAARLQAAAPLELPPMVDVEDAEGKSVQALTDWTITVLNGIQGILPDQVPMLYTYRWFLSNALDASRLAQWPLSLAAWTTIEQWPDDRASYWQYAGDVGVPWSTGRVDLQRHRERVG